MRTFLCFALLALAALATVSAAKYPDPKLPGTETTVLATAHTKRFIHVFSVGSNSSILWHKYVDLQDPSMTWSAWLIRAVAQNGTWDTDACTGTNIDGTVEVFMRYSTNLDTWQLYQINPNDPLGWQLRDSSCPTAPDCPSPWWNYFWNSQMIFPTSDCQVVPDPSDGTLQMYYRGFTGEYYRVRQQAPGNHNYYPPENFGQSSVME